MSATTAQRYKERADATRAAAPSNKPVYGTALRRKAFTMHSWPLALKAEHPAVQESRTLFPGTRVDPSNSADPRASRVLKSGVNSVKIGRMVVKGRLKGAPVFTVTLEERATCPSSCAHWLDCYGNKMHWAHRFAGNGGLIQRLHLELRDLQERHPDGFLVRLHVLGDFWSREYVEAWEVWLDLYPALHVFGFTAWQRNTEIGVAVWQLSKVMGARWRVRTSGVDDGHGAVTVADAADAPVGAIVCPAQTGKTECCSTCALCWTANKTIAFLEH